MFAKLLLFVAFSGIFASPVPELTDEQKELAAIHEECMQASGLTEDTSGSFPNLPALREHLLCTAKKMGVVSESGEPQPEVIRDRIKQVISTAESKIDEAVQSCAVSKGSPEQTAFEMAKCLYNKQKGEA